MKYKHLSILLVLLSITPFAQADLLVDKFEPVFRIKLGHLQISGFRVSVENTGARLERVTARLKRNRSDFWLIRPRLFFGNIDSFDTRRSFNGFLVIAPRTVNLDDAYLRDAIDVDYRFKFDVSLAAQVVDDPIPNAIVTADVSGTQTTVLADASGNFSVDLSLAGFDDFVTLDAVGGPGQESVALRSLVGSALNLHNATGSVGGSTLLTGNEVQSLDITHVTTAKAVLAESINGGPITSATELLTAEFGLDTLELLRLSTALKLIIDDPNVNLPAGYLTTLDFLQDLPAADAFAAALQANNSVAYNAAQAATLAGASSGGFVANDVDGSIYSTILRNLGVIVGEQIVFNADGSAQRIDANGSFTATWSITPEGTLSFIPIGGEFIRPAEGFSLQCAPIVNSGVRTQTIYLGSVFNLVLRGNAIDLVTEESETFARFPDNPECPETAPAVSAPTIAFRWVNEFSSLDYTAADFAGKEIVLTFWSSTPTRPLLGNAFSETGQDLFSFDADGTGTTRITGRDFQWLIDADGHLVITMTTGEINEYVSLGTDIDGDVNSAINTGTTANGTFAFRSFQVDVDSSFALTPATFVGPTFVSGSDEQRTFVAQANRPTNEFVFNVDGSWLQNGLPPFNDPAAAWSNPDGRLEYTFTAFGSTRQDVSWVPVAIIGGRYWVLEARQLGPVGDPQFVDLGAATGFLTYYRPTP